MINNYCNQENDVYVETLPADKAVSDLSEDQLRDVLEQLTDHNLPDSEKCPLVRRLNAENASKDESDLVISRFCKTSSNASTSSTCRNNRKSRYLQRSGSKDAEFAREKTNGSNLKKVHSSQSLQDLMSGDNIDYDSTTVRALGANAGKRLNKASRAKSFTMPSGSQHFCNNNNINIKENFSELLSSPELRTSSQSQTQHSLKGTRNKSLKSRPTQHISTSSVTSQCENIANDSNVKSDPESGVCSAALTDPTISSRTLRECFATQSVYPDNHNIDCDKNCTNLCNSSAPALEHQFCAETTQYIEMKDLGRKVNIIEYTSERDNTDCQHKSYNNVDSFADFGLKPVNTKDGIKTGVAERVVNHNCDLESKDYMSNMSEDNKLLQFQGNDAISRAYDPNNPYQDSDIANSQHQNKDNALRNSNNSREKKKKRTEAPVKLSEEIEGHIGFRDVEYLEAFVNSTGNESSKPSTEVNSKNGTLFMSNSSVKESVKKNSKSIQMTNNVSKRKNANVSPNQSASQTAVKNSVSPNIPLSTSSSSSFSSDETNSVGKHSDFAQRTETTSPLNSSSDSKNKRVVNREDSDHLDDQKRSHSTINSSFSLIGSNISAELLYTASDSEMADREKGFVTPKSKHLKRRKGLMRRTDDFRTKTSPNCSMRSSTSTTPSSSTVSGVVGYERFAGMRGYESELEYTDDYRRIPNSSSCGRRKSLSSVPHSEQNSAYNSDGELSSHSMPIRNDSLNTEKSNSESRTTPSSISSTPKASYADIAKTSNFGLSLAKRSSVDAIYTTNTTIGSLSINTCVQYQDFPQLDLSLPPVADASNPSSANHSMIKALVSPPQKAMTEKRDLTSDSYSAPTSMTNTPIPQNECLFSDETNKDSKDTSSDLKTSEKSDLSLVPAVIMCDYSESVPLSDIGSVTFGFFDDELTANSAQQLKKSENKLISSDSTELKAKSCLKTSPESDVSGADLTYIDVDKKSFNYEHIIGFIQKAWDNAKRDYQSSS